MCGRENNSPAAALAPFAGACPYGFVGAPGFPCWLFIPGRCEGMGHPYWASSSPLSAPEQALHVWEKSKISQGGAWRNQRQPPQPCLVAFQCQGDGLDRAGGAGSWGKVGDSGQSSAGRGPRAELAWLPPSGAGGWCYRCLSQSRSQGNVSWDPRVSMGSLERKGWGFSREHQPRAHRALLSQPQHWHRGVSMPWGLFLFVYFWFFVSVSNFSSLCARGMTWICESELICVSIVRCEWHSRGELAVCRTFWILHTFLLSFLRPVELVVLGTTLQCKLIQLFHWKLS